jgi:hypothetical protein
MCSAGFESRGKKVNTDFNLLNKTSHITNIKKMLALYYYIPPWSSPFVNTTLRIWLVTVLFVVDAMGLNNFFNCLNFRLFFLKIIERIIIENPSFSFSILLSCRANRTL